MKAVKINKNFYEFFETKEIGGQQVEVSIGFDSYTNTLQYEQEVEAKLLNIRQRRLAIENLGMTEEDIDIIVE